MLEGAVEAAEHDELPVTTHDIYDYLFCYFRLRSRG